MKKFLAKICKIGLFLLNLHKILKHMGHNQKKWTEIEEQTVKLIKDTFARELAIRRMKPYEFLKDNRMTVETNSLLKMLAGKTGCNVLTLARIADAFGYDIDLVKRIE